MKIVGATGSGGLWALEWGTLLKQNWRDENNTFQFQFFI